MRLVPAVSACLLALATLGASPAQAAPTGGATEVIGGSNAVAGKWPDVAAVLFPDPNGDEALCTGTLVAPTVVLTAGHCFDSADPPLPDNVLIGTSTLARPGDGETIAIARGFVYPDAENSEDVTVLILAEPSSRTPRPIATGWAAAEIANGTKVSLVGYGAIDKDGAQFINELQEATTTITDADCSKASGCNALARPAGELGAGGKGIDTCPGDSGGPLYLATSYGTFLAGVTSRSYDNAKVSCSDGGIYERPDKFVDWIERVAQVPVARGPEPFAAPVVAMPGGSGDVMLHVNDPGSDDHDFQVEVQPAHGMAGVRYDGMLRVCPDADAAPGADAVTVKLIDGKHDHRSVLLTVAIQIQDGTPAVPGCDLGAFHDDGGGCCDSGHGTGGAIPLTIGVLALLRGRRRRVTLGHG